MTTLFEDLLVAAAMAALDRIAQRLQADATATPTRAEEIVADRVEAFVNFAVERRFARQELN